jgi:hypothetical protein
MTKVWGPLGWMTLHSISVCYPDEPTATDKQFLVDFMNGFAATITCITCRNHFNDLFNNYRQDVPSWLNSKKDLFLMVCRIHNSVNKRLDKPIPKTVEECLSFLKNATSYTSQFEFREKYIEYLFRDWNIYGRGTSYLQIALSHANKMKKINEEYWNTKDVSYDSIQWRDGDVVTLPGKSNQTINGPIKFNLNKFRFKFKLPK